MLTDTVPISQRKTPTILPINLQNSGNSFSSSKILLANAQMPLLQPLQSLYQVRHESFRLVELRELKPRMRHARKRLDLRGRASTLELFRVEVAFVTERVLARDLDVGWWEALET